MAYVESTGAIFRDKKYAEKCWTHDLDALLVLAGLESALDLAVDANATMGDNWKLVIQREETTRYKQKTQVQAQSLYDDAINNPNGILPWIRIHW